MKSKQPKIQSSHDLLQTGLAHHESGRLREAEVLYRQILASDPLHFDALHLLGVIVNQTGDSTQAIELISRAIQQNPRHPFAHNNLGLAFQALGRLEEATASYRQALSIRPDFSDAHYNLGNVLQAQGKLDEAIASYRQALALQPNDAEAHNNLGSALRSQGRLDEAIARYRQALAFRPNYAEAYNNLAVALQEQGRLDEASSNLYKAIALKPDYADAYNNLGVVFWRVGNLDQAVASFRKALSIMPDYAEAHSNLGNVFQKQGRFDEAIAAYRQALALKPDYAQAYIYLGSALRRQGNVDEAIESFHKALTIMPDLAEAHIGLADVNIDMGQFDAAQSFLSMALKIEPKNPSACALLSTLRKMSLDDAEWLKTALELASDPALSWEKMIPLQFALGKYYDDTKQYDLAFPAYQKANLLKRHVEGKFDRTGFSRLIDDLIATYNANFMQQQIDGSSSSELPVLIVGMPRSATSLTEQIIASHPDAFGAGELRFWGKHAEANQAAIFSGNHAPSLLARLATEYQQYLRQHSPNAHRIVDKMPGNFLWLGLIHTVFPQAKIIHTRRHPIDTCLSIYFQDLLPSHSYGTDLDDLAFYYREYDRLMRHWRAVLPTSLFLEVTYEALTDNQAEWSRRIIEFIGLEWNERCLDFHKTERKVGTWSNWQVRQKIYHSSKERWRNYEKYLGPLLSLQSLA